MTYMLIYQSPPIPTNTQRRHSAMHFSVTVKIIHKIFLEMALLKILIKKVINLTLKINFWGVNN